jgi:hypothetical protein
VNCFWLHLKTECRWFTATRFLSGMGTSFFFSSRVNLLFLQAPGHTNARCQCSIDASARRLARGVCTRVHIRAVHFDAGVDQASHAVGWKKKLTWQRPRKKGAIIIESPPFSSANYSSIQFIPSKTHRLKITIYILLYIYSALNENSPNPLHTIY